MPPATYSIKVFQGDDFEITLRVRESAGGAYVNLTGYTVTAQYRVTRDASTSVAFAVAMQNQTTLPGAVVLSLTKTQTAALTQNGYWDVQFTTPGGKVQTYLRGHVWLASETTR